MKIKKFDESCFLFYHGRPKRLFTFIRVAEKRQFYELILLRTKKYNTVGSL